MLVADAFRRHGRAVRAPNVLQTAAAPNDYYGALFIDAKQIESTVQIGRDDERSSDTGLAFVVSRRLGRSVGAWDPA